MIEVISEILYRFVDLVVAPFDYPDMLWIIIPLFLTMILIETYFARYKYEDEDWNSAFGNTLVLVFVAIDLFRILYNRNELTYINERNVLAITLVVVGALLSTGNFLHIWSKEFALGVSAKLPINFLAYMAIILVYTKIPFDLITLFASIMVMVLFISVVVILRMIIPNAIELDEDEYKERRNAPNP